MKVVISPNCKTTKLDWVWACGSEVAGGKLGVPLIALLALGECDVFIAEMCRQFIIPTPTNNWLMHVLEPPQHSRRFCTNPQPTTPHRTPPHPHPFQPPLPLALFPLPPLLPLLPPLPVLPLLQFYKLVIECPCELNNGNLMF